MLFRSQGSFGMGPWEKVQDFSLYDRCITRGNPGSYMPVVYGNGARIIQTPDSVVIAYEMVHDTRVIPLDGRPHIGSGIRQLMGDSRGRWEGNTLVIETTNFTDRTAIGPNGNGPRHSEAARMTERLTRTSANDLKREITFEEPTSWSRPWTILIEMGKTNDNKHMIFDSACHEGNYGMVGILSGARREEAAAAGKK